MAVTATDKDVSCPYNEIHYQFVGMYMLFELKYIM